MNWVCAQIGARENYAIPRAFARTGRLQRLYTDVWATPVAQKWLRRSRVPAARSWAARQHAELAGAQVKSMPLRALGWELAARRRRWWPGAAPASQYFEYIRIGRAFARQLRRSLGSAGLDARTAFFSYDTGALEVLEWLKTKKVWCVVGQMDPGLTEYDAVREEVRRWPGWQEGAGEVPAEYQERRRREWALADRVVVNSDFSRAALEQQGVPAEKLVILPLCYEAGDAGRENGGPAREDPTLRVLWLGQVILRKGIQYLVEAAKLLANTPVQFDIVGPLGISAAAVASFPANVRYHGRALRDDVSRWYQVAHVFVLPTISDGFALTQLEAMAYGVPVIATPNCGAVVRPEVDGLIVPARDGPALARAIARFLEDESFRRECGQNARRRVRDFSMEALCARLSTLEPAGTSI